MPSSFIIFMFLGSRKYLLDEADKQLFIDLFNAHFTLERLHSGKRVKLCKALLYACRLQSITAKVLTSGSGYKPAITS
jgi:hypothetical protein